MKCVKKIGIFALCATLLVPTGCSTFRNMNSAGKNAVVGGAAGGAVGAGIGAIIGGGRGTWIGALLGSAIGAGAGALIGNEMDKQKRALEEELAGVRALAEQNAAENAAQNEQINNNTYSIQTIQDSNNLKAIKLVLGNAIMFDTGSAQLSALADATLSRIAYNLKQFPNSDVTIVGYTDSTGSAQLNQQLSQQRANAVMNYLISQGISASRLQAIGDGPNNPVASNATAEGRAQNRRVEMYITAGKDMINQYNQ